MNKRIIAFLVVEALIIIGLLFHIVHQPRFLWMIIPAVIFTLLGRRGPGGFRTVSWILWAIVGINFLTIGWFWMALIFPALAVIFLIRQNVQQPQTQRFSAENEKQNSHQNGNDVIDLFDVNFKREGNHLTIKKKSGNTKIIVPSDVAVKLDLTTKNGIIKIFNQAAQINSSNVRYFTENAEEFDKKIRISVYCETGNIEVVRG